MLPPTKPEAVVVTPAAAPPPLFDVSDEHVPDEPAVTPEAPDEEDELDTPTRPYGADLGHEGTD